MRPDHPGTPCSILEFHNNALEEIFFWKNNIASLNSRSLSQYNVPKFIYFSDASNVACGGFLDGNSAVCHRMWNESECVKSSTWRELKAIHFCLISFHQLIAGSSVKWHADNQAAVRILEVGSSKLSIFFSFVLRIM